ncbi:MAG: hypothetical protein AAGB93_04420 [Planctomycetota bacterium]
MRPLRPALALCATVVLASAGTAQHDPARPDPTHDQSTAPPSELLPFDLTVPEFEPAPPDGWPSSSQVHVDPYALDAPAPGASGNALSARDAFPGLAGRLSVDAMLTGPLVDVDRSGEAWARVRHMRAHLDGQGMEVLPVFGRRSQREWPVRFDLASARVGDQAIDVTPVSGPEASERQLVLRRGGLREVYLLDVESVEQTFVFDELPGAGALVLEIGVTTDLLADSGEALVFRHATLGEVEYGAAFAVDAAGRRIPVERTFDGETITLTVPPDFVETASLPLTVDPVVSTRSLGNSFADDRSPDVTFAGRPLRYFVVWEEFTSATNADCYVTSFDLATAQHALIEVDISAAYWDSPRIAYVPANDRLLVVASVTDDGPGTGNGHVGGRILNAASESAVGPALFVSPVGSEKVEPDVGGTNFLGTSSNHFLVAWSRIVNSTTSNLEYRVIDWTGLPVTAVFSVVTAQNARVRRPAISESHGDANLAGDFWTLAWIRDDVGLGTGQLWGRRVVFNGSFNVGAGSFLIDASSMCRNVSVTSRLDEPVPGIGDRPSIVAYEKRVLGFPARQSIFVRAVVDGAALSESAVSEEMEDFRGTLNQTRPSIGTDGRGFILTYSEDFFGGPGTGDLDMYMCSGHLHREQNDASIALAERHQLMGGTLWPETDGRVAMVQDGRIDSADDDGMCVWTKDTAASSNGGEINLAYLDIATTPSVSSRAVGRQYCNANRNSTGSPIFPTSSWLWILGDQSLGTPHSALCLDMPLMSFGYLTCSRVSGNVNMPGGSQGRLCLGGSIGRYVNQIVSSGTSGSIETGIDPLSLPQPTGLVAAQPGERWNFQVWHRDVANGLATSNFSNACAVTFRP